MHNTDTDGGGWTFVNERSKSRTNVDDLTSVTRSSVNRFQYDLLGMGYDEVLVERVQGDTPELRQFKDILARLRNG